MPRPLFALLVTAVALTWLPAAGADGAKSFDQRVNEAIDKGVAYLKSRQKADGTWPEQREGFQPGSDALCLLALAKSGVHTDDPVMQRGFARLLKQPFHKTYTVAVTIMAIEAAFCSQNPKEQYSARKAWGGTKSLVPGGKAPGKIDNKQARKRMEEAVRWLLKVYNAQLKGWRYQGNDGCDNSHNQYVLLAFKSACRCGLGRLIPNEMWRTMLEVMIERQEQNGPLVKGPLGTRKSTKKYGKNKGSIEVKDYWGYAGRRKATEARGWGYDVLVPDEVTTGSMTSAGIAIVQLCRDEVWRRKDRKYKKKLDLKALAAIDSGIAWMAKHFKVTENMYHPKKEWHYYYLYGVERVGAFCGLEKIGKHDWYREGAEYLLTQQHKSGSWPDEEKTCYALLFLKRSTYPLNITGK